MNQPSMAAFGSERKLRTRVLIIFTAFLLFATTFGKAEILSVLTTGEESIKVTVATSGLSRSDARSAAIREVLQLAVEQLIVADRIIEGSEITKDEIITTYNGFVRSFREIEYTVINGEHHIEATVDVSLSAITNYVGIVSSGRTEIDSDSLFAEALRAKENIDSLRKMLSRYFNAFPSAAYDVKIAGLGVDATDSRFIELTVEMEPIPSFSQSIQQFLERTASAERRLENDSAILFGEPGSHICLGRRGYRHCFSYQDSELLSELSRRFSASSGRRSGVLIGFFDSSGQLMNARRSDNSEASCYLGPISVFAQIGTHWNSEGMPLGEFRVGNRGGSVLTIDLQRRSGTLKLNAAGLDLARIAEVRALPISVVRGEAYSDETLNYEYSFDLPSQINSARNSVFGEPLIHLLTVL